MAHEHKFYAFQIKQIFVPFTTREGKQFYKLEEYIYSTCACGEPKKTKIEKEDTA